MAQIRLLWLFWLVLLVLVLVPQPFSWNTIVLAFYSLFLPKPQLVCFLASFTLQLVQFSPWLLVMLEEYSLLWQLNEGFLKYFVFWGQIFGIALQTVLCWNYPVSYAIIYVPLLTFLPVDDIIWEIIPFQCSIGKDSSAPQIWYLHSNIWTCFLYYYYLIISFIIRCKIWLFWIR